MISTHILDTTLGAPAGAVTVRLSKNGTLLFEEQTNGDGRIVFATKPEAGTYELHFVIQDYYVAKKQEHFFRDARIVFTVTDTQRKYHVPLVINPYGYSTYRGS